ncbi:MAG: imidazolonepropionase [Candidatus Marinimicrobia bacterium]|nr:imidazolonepropionase [Candidatus Neomarinimicrobiota bacterium]
MKTIIKNIGQLVTYNSEMQGMKVFQNVEMIMEDGKIIETGTDLYSSEMEVIDAKGKLVTPGFIDAHTHPVFYKTREKEFEMRIMGKTYHEIAAAGGGIRASARRLREGDPKILKQQTLQNIKRFFCFGTTTIEAKSGYGLSTASELTSLRILKEINETCDLDILATFLGAHEFPESYQNDHEGYIDKIVGEMLPVIVRENLAQFCDAFCEEGVFSVEETRRVLEPAKSLGLGIRIHADEFKPIGGVELAAKLGACSADHLIAITDEGIEALKENNVVPVVLPATMFFLGSEKYAPARKMWDQGLPVAIATDFNPGSSHTQSMPFVITTACLKMRLTPLEALQAATFHAAKSLKIENKVGSLEIGKQADFCIWEFDNYQGIPYYLASTPVYQVYKKGKKVWEFEI